VLTEAKKQIVKVRSPSIIVHAQIAKRMARGRKKKKTAGTVKDEKSHLLTVLNPMRL